jgi:hypothetical protein
MFARFMIPFFTVDGQNLDVDFIFIFCGCSLFQSSFWIERAHPLSFLKPRCRCAATVLRFATSSEAALLSHASSIRRASLAAHHRWLNPAAPFPSVSSIFQQMKNSNSFDNKNCLLNKSKVNTCYNLNQALKRAPAQN